jgi:hypothetical protein
MRQRAICVLAAVAISAYAYVSPSQAANLVTNGDFESGNSGFSTGYNFVASGQSATPGTYAVRTLSTNFNSAYNSFGDHTSGTGNMMLLDGLGSNTTAWTETIPVSPGSDTTFSVWVTSSDNENLPVLRFSIDGTQVGSDLTLPGVETGADWVNFIANWNSGINSSAVLTIADVNPTPLATGNDFALDDISFTASAVPEPAAIGSILSGAIVLILNCRRRHAIDVGS